MSVVSERICAADAAFAAIRDFYLTSRYGKRRGDPSICDLTFGNPHEMPLGGLVTALRERGCQNTRTGLLTRPAKKSRKPFSPSVFAANWHCLSSHPTLLLLLGHLRRSRWRSTSCLILATKQ